jgi:acetyl esterase/lipase
MAGSPAGSVAWKVLYSSTGLDGKANEVSGVVVAPDLPPPSAGRNVVAFAHGTTGVADDCGPSNFRDFFERIPHLHALLALDYVVAATDYEGLGPPGVHPYLVGVSEARSVLDSVRAAREVPGSGAGKRFVAWGHSQGGHAALFTGQLAGSYAPELELSGVAAIAPATDLEVLLKDDLGERAGRILGAFAVWSWSKVFDVSLEGVVLPGHIPGIEKVAGDCIESVEEVLQVGLDSLGLPSNVLEETAFSEEPWKGLLEQNRPGQAPAGAPLFVAQGSEDRIVRPSVTADFVADLCRQGEVVRFEPLPGVDHMRSGRTSATAAIQWMRDRLDGKPEKNGCAAPAL